jgi:hypothetical protein
LVKLSVSAFGLDGLDIPAPAPKKSGLFGRRR